MSWTLHTIHNGLGRNRLVWNALNVDLCRENPYFDSDFVEPLLAHFATGSERLCVHVSDGEVDALLIAVPSRHGKWSLFVPPQAQIAPILVRRPEVLRTLIPCLPGIVLGMDMLYQDPCISPFAKTEAGLSCVCSPHAHTLRVRIEGPFSSYWAARSGKLRNNVVRRMRRLQDAGISQRLVRVSDPSDMVAAVERFGELESKGWKGEAGTAVHSDNVQGRFYSDVLSRFAMKGMASVYQLFFDDALVAMQLCISSRNTLVLLKTTYEESQSIFSPGRLLLYFLLQEEFSRKVVHDVEFYTNADRDQLAWATHDRWISHYLMFRNPLHQALYRHIREVLKTSRQFITAKV